MKGIVLHGGRGTRLRPLTHTGPKQLIPVGGKAISQYVLEDIRDAGIREVALVLGNVGADRVQEYYGDGSRIGLKITYVNQDSPKGIADAVRLCREFVGNDKFVVFLGDNLLKGGVAGYAKDFESSGADAMLLLTRVKDPEHFGVAEFDPSGRLKGVVEKPKYAPSPYIVTGIYFFTPMLFNAIAKVKPSARGELEITDSIQAMIGGSAKVAYRFVEGWWKDTGTIEDILEANRLILDERLTKSSISGVVEDGASVEGRVNVEEGAVIRPKAVLRGPCHIGAQTIVGPGSYVGPYTSIGRFCHVENVEMENSILFDNCEVVGIKQRISDSIVGQFSKLTGEERRQSVAHFVIGESSIVTL